MMTINKRNVVMSLCLGVISGSMLGAVGAPSFIIFASAVLLGFALPWIETK